MSDSPLSKPDRSPGLRRLGVIAAALTMLAPSLAQSAAKPKTYILIGYSWSGLHGAVDTKALEAKLGRKEGARITNSDIAADAQIVGAELKARHAHGKLFTTLAEKHGHVWIIFDLLDPDAPIRRFWQAPRHLTAQSFQGGGGIPTSDLAAATGLKPGDLLSPEKMAAARRAIIEVYAKALPAKAVTVRGKLQGKETGDLALTWVITQK